MRKAVVGCLWAVVLFASAAARPAAQSASLNAELLKDWTDQKAMMMKIAEAMPEDSSR